METILIVEDDRTYARATANWLARNGMDTRYVLSADAAKEFLGSHEATSENSRNSTWLSSWKRLWTRTGFWKII